jgi:two-component system chemotaxis response regulator CheY
MAIPTPVKPVTPVPHRILIVDDAATVRLYHRKILADAGWHTEDAANGVEALERVHSQAAGSVFDLYVVDVNMPRLDGYSFVRELRRLGAAHQAPVLMVSSEAQRRDASAALEAGANAYLVKPALPHDLLLTAALLLGDAPVAAAAAAATAKAAAALKTTGARA